MCISYYVVFFLFKQQTAYEMRISDWSSDVCSSDLGIKGESIQRNIEDIRAALNHAANNGRIPYVPKIPSVPKEKRVAMILQRCGFLLRRNNDPRPKPNPRPTH